ncbi:hypothetical protein [Carboxylicivirga sp. M1479]|uniref:hypothetical protein n=1 Tax=Carboxylicivirga sp. M1479 TaxID=2594476 RepID=UPI0011783B65|nr:hypothetical protein [Carboxylicivirga sp. M1479]TRX71094.1 hypothetical protein FNN09_07690 [Carboxylicivirga sp. M1479]
MKSIVCFVILIAVLGCTGNDSKESENPIAIDYAFSVKPIEGDDFIADYRVANEEVLRAIPQAYIDLARNNLRVAYQHTSHGTHVSYGLYGLQDYKDGDEKLFGITRYGKQPDKLDVNDYVIQKYAEEGTDASDLSREETAFIQATRNYLDDPLNAEINVVMWAWCSIRHHDLEGVYLPGMQTLIDEYGSGGSKIGNGDGQRRVPVCFVFMTGHARKNLNLGDGYPEQQAAIVNAYCQKNKLLCLDYYSIDTHCMNDIYWDDASDDGYSEKYANANGGSGNYYHDWQNSHVLGTHYYENKIEPKGEVVFGNHTTQHVISNRKAYAMWWILARISGWDGKSIE